MLAERHFSRLSVRIAAAFVIVCTVAACTGPSGSSGGSGPQPPNAAEKLVDAREAVAIRIEAVITGVSGTDLFQAPAGVAVGSNGALYVADVGGKRVVQFDAAGRYLGQIGSSDAAGGGLTEPVDIAASSDGSLAVLDRATGNIVVFDASGALARSFPGPGLYNPYGIGFGSAGVVVADTGTGRLIRFESNGNVAVEFAGREVKSGATFDPTGVTSEPDGTIVAVDGARGTLQRYRPDGAFVSGIDVAANGLARVVRLKDGSFLISDPSRSRLVRWTSDGKLLARYQGTDDVELVHPSGLAVDSAGAVYIADTDANRVIRATLP